MQPESKRKPNRLIFEKSPYLLQHAHNPVNWYPWSPEAFKKAEDEDKPIFLSIGYSTCHWCHVMEKESFEDAEVAELLNDAFVCIKVDREERPDLDSVYMKVCQQLTGSGGWPLHIIMTPDKKPFFAATYMPRESRFGQVGMKELIPKVKELWTSRRNELLEQAVKVTRFLEETEKGSHETSAAEELGASTMDEAYFQLSRSFDPSNGGFGNAPKFPSPHNLTFLLRYWKRTSDRGALEMVDKTLKAMRLGGIYDQLGFGFHRYSTDAKWLLPHFEKMLYDQAMLTMAYAEAYQATGDEEFKQAARETITYVLRDMTDPAGGFYSAEDADSEGEEGKFYLWIEEEIRQLLPAEEAEFAIKIFDVEKDGNFEDAMTGKRTGNNTLHLEKSPTQIAIDMHNSPQDVQKRLDQVRKTLFDFRQKRVRPGRDDKILVDWNGLMIAALSKAAQAFDEPEYANAAKRAADFILNNMRDSEKRLYHRYRDGEAKVNGFLADYAFFVWGLVELYETVLDAEYLQRAVELTEMLMKHFWDEQRGGFYLTPDDADVTLVRGREIYDGALPSGNSVACLNLIRLAHMTGETQYEQKAAQLMRSFASAVSRAPSACTQLMSALDFAIGPSCEVILVGDPRKADTKRLIEALRSRFAPRKVVLLRSKLGQRQGTRCLDAFTQGLTSKEGKATAYVCCNRVCNPPTTDPDKMIELIGLQES
ncbi:MAG: thioredoxin domain-containing protein [Candidatus Bathyarchaeia archaeon]